MDDILVASITKNNPVKKMIQEVDNALTKGHFQVKKWTKTGDKDPVKFFSYKYHPQSDTFNVCPHVNWSPKRSQKRTRCQKYCRVI